MTITIKKIDTLELRLVSSFVKEDSYYYEIVKWYPNDLYNRKDDFEWDERRQMYRNKDVNYYYVTESSFKHPFSCYTLAFFDDYTDEMPDMRCVGNRPFDDSITDDEYKNLRELVCTFYEDRVYEKTLDEIKEIYENGNV